MCYNQDMKMINTAPLSGMQELLPKKQEIFENLRTQIEHIYKKHGFWKIETPIIERKEVLLAKAGGETEKQIYFVSKTNDGTSDEALRFDHTVPLARYVTEHSNDLPFPFKVTQVGRNFRGERAQKGRFREFYQCDVDVIGRNNLPVAYDADIIAVLTEALAVFGLDGLVVRINNRKILRGLMVELGLETKAGEIMGIIDKAEKVPAETTKTAMLDLGLEEKTVAKILDFIQIKGGSKTVAEDFAKLGIKNEDFLAGVAELTEVLKILEEQNLAVTVRADMMIVRGLDYYTGTVFEVFVDEDRSLGSLCGGGRYENLTGYFSEQKFPGVGGSIGLTRLFSVLDRKGLLDNLRMPETEQKLAIIPISAQEIGFALNFAKEKRAEGWTAEVVMLDKKLGDKLAYAGRIADFAAVIGENEVKTGEIELKPLNKA